LFVRPYCDRREERLTQVTLEGVRFKFNDERICRIGHLTRNISHFFALSSEAEPESDFVSRIGDAKLRPCAADTLTPFLPIPEQNSALATQV
jgi:hypothetical protein